ncbi:hypothetical protein [Comamonas sp.]|uniref:hypothetical protein n=1 Tax=Comamonas sp. TaxID=34028 RepID=UPI003A92891A
MDANSIFDPNAWEQYATDVGPQTDGTVLPSYSATTPAPTDAGGGAPTNYSQTVLDVFKIGVGAWSANAAQQNMLDYRRWEATGGGLYQQGAVGYPRPGTINPRMSGNTILLLVGMVAALMLVK